MVITLLDIGMVTIYGNKKSCPLRQLPLLYNVSIISVCQKTPFFRKWQPLITIEFQLYKAILLEFLSFEKQILNAHSKYSFHLTHF